MRTVFLFAFAVWGFVMALLLRQPTPAPDTREPPVIDMVSGATPVYEPPPETFTLGRDEALRMAAEVAALSVLRGGPQHLQRSDAEGIGRLDRNNQEAWVASDREYGFGTPAMQWLWDGEVPDRDNAPRALAALLARRVIDLLLTDDGPGWDEVTAGEVQPMLCEVRQLRNRSQKPSRDKYAACVLGTMPVADPDLDEAMKCATAIVGRNMTQIQTLADAYGRELTPSVFGDFDPVAYNGAEGRKDPKTCDNGRHCGSFVHEAVFAERPLDMLTTHRRGLPAFCRGKEPVRWKSPLRGGLPDAETVMPIRDGGGTFVSMASRQIIGEYLLTWDVAKMKETPDSDAFLEHLPVLAYLFGPVLPMDMTDKPQRAGILATGALVPKYAALIGEGEEYRGRRFGGVTSRFTADHSVCVLGRLDAFGDDFWRMSAERLGPLWANRCSGWAAGSSRMLPASVDRLARSALAAIETCARAVNAANEDAYRELAAVLAPKLAEAVKDSNKSATTYMVRMSVQEMLDVFASHPPVLPKECAALPPNPPLLTRK